MKRFLFTVLAFVIFSSQISYSSTFDLSIGGGYRFGANYTYNYLLGFHQILSVPFSMTFYPGNNELLSIGFKNKIGYAFTIYSKDKRIIGDDFVIEIKFNNYPYEHEVYDNLSFLLKAGRSIKFVWAIGCTFKYSFVSIPDGNFEIRYNPYNPVIDFSLIKPGNFNYPSLGPSMDFGMEVLNKSRTFAFYLGLPMDFVIPLMNIDRVKVKSEISGNYIYLIPSIDNSFYLNFSIGFEFGFSFYYQK
jgi:hypothetical protein